MKENGIEKLYNLLLEYEEEVKKSDGFYLYYIDLKDGEILLCNAKEGTYLDYTESQTILISHSYGFIKWLVDNDKIDWHNVGNKTMVGQLAEYHGLSDEKILLMLLSIQDNPIELLISVLK